MTVTISSKGERFTPSQVLEQIADLDPETYRHDDGTINYSALGRATGIAVSTISRIHRGSRDGEASVERADSWKLSVTTMRALQEAFHLSTPEVLGEVPITTAKGKRGKRARYEPTAADIELLRQLRSLSPSAQREVQALVAIKEQLEGKDS